MARKEHEKVTVKDLKKAAGPCVTNYFLGSSTATVPNKAASISLWSICRQPHTPCVETGCHCCPHFCSPYSRAEPHTCGQRRGSAACPGKVLERSLLETLHRVCSMSQAVQRQAGFYNSNYCQQSRFWVMPSTPSWPPAERRFWHAS